MFNGKGKLKNLILLVMVLTMFLLILSACSGSQSSLSKSTISVTAASETEIYNNGNLLAVLNSPVHSTTFTITGSYKVTLITDYHWNNGQGASAGTIALKDSNGKIIGTWPVNVRSKVYWDASPNTVIGPGTYTVIDSDTSTWSQNSQSNGAGITDVKGDAITYTVQSAPVNQTSQLSNTGTVSTSVTTPRTAVTLALTALVSKTVQPSDADQQVSWNNQITVTVPGGLLTDHQSLSISSVTNPPPETFVGASPLAAYDVTLGNQHQFSKDLTIEIAYDPTQIQSGLPEDQSIYAEWWDSSQNMWWRSVSQIDTQRHVVDIKTDHLTPWRLVMAIRGDHELRTDHFIVVFNDKEAPTIAGVTQNPLTFAGKVGDYLEAAYKVYLAAGYEVTPPNSGERTWVIIDQSSAESSTGTLSGDITLKSQFRDDNEVKQDTAHELFHTTHLRKVGVPTYLQSQWFAEACADYAATHIAWPDLPGMALLSGDYMRSSMPTVDAIHEYENAQFVAYLMGQGITFSQLFNEMCKSVPTTASLDACLQKLTGKSLLDHYRNFLAYAFFDSKGPVQSVYLSPSLLKGSGSPKGAPNNLSVATKSISYQMLMNGNYGGWLWGFSVDTANAATTRTLTFNIKPLVDDGLPSGKADFDIYILKNDQRVTGGAQRQAVLSGDKRTANLTVSAGDVVYIMGVDALDSGIADQIDVLDTTSTQAKSYVVDCAISPADAVSAGCQVEVNGNYTPGGTVYVTISEASGYKFSGFSGGEDLTFTQAAHWQTFIMPSHDVHLVANFIKLP